MHREKVRAALALSSWSWGDLVRKLEAANLAHRCADLKRGSVRFLLEPATVCPVPSCGQTLPRATVERGSEQRSTLPGATESVLRAGDAPRDAEGDATSWLLPSEEQGSAAEPLQEGSSETAALIRRERELGLADVDIASLLNRSGRIVPPEGFSRWTGHGIRVALGEVIHAA